MSPIIGRHLPTDQKMTSPEPKIIIKMSLELFHEVPAGAIETLFDDQNQPLFKRTDLGKYLGIEDIKHNFKDFPSYYTRPRSDIEAGRQAPSFGRTKNPYDIFINLDGSIEMAVRSKKPKAVALVKWLTKKGVEKIQEVKFCSLYHRLHNIMMRLYIK